MALGTAPIKTRRSIPWIWLIVVGITVPLVVVLAIGLQRDPRAIPSPLVGKLAPPVTLQLFDRTTLNTERYRGHVLIMNFWASWCYPACYEEAPELQQVWERYKEQGVIVIGINVQDQEVAAAEFIRRFGQTFPNGMDQTGRISIDYGVYGVPETFIIDAQGRITYKHVGAITAQIIAERVTPLVRGSP